jgi:spermidine synthase
LIVNDSESLPELHSRQLAVLMGSVLIVALCGIAYELIIATVSSYLLGNSVYQFSITIGLFMFAMGIGAYLTKQFAGDLVSAFVVVEIAVALVGGLSCTILFLVFPYYALYTPVMYALILIIGILVGLEIPLLTRILSEKESLRSSIAHVLSLDYVGALIGSVAFPLVLLPHFGLFRASYAIGLLNVLVVYLALLVFGRRLRWRRLCASGAVAVTAVLLAGLYYSTAIRGFAEGKLFASAIVFEQQTPYQRIILTQSDRNDTVRLYLDGHLQFAEQDEYRYHETLVHGVMALPGPRAKILILGGGDGLAAREVLKYTEVERIDLVDIDPAMTAVSRIGPIARLNEYSLDDPKVHLHHLDAFNFVRESEERFDRVIIDLPDPHNEALTKLYSVEFYRMLRRCLAADGYFITQSSSPYFTREVFWCIARTIQEAGMTTRSLHITVPSFGIWGFTLAAADGDLPHAAPITVPTRFLSEEVLAAATVFGPDIDHLPVPVNSITQPQLYQLYQRGMAGH